MPAVKIKRASSAVDMTAMTDVAFLLLTFFILTAQFKSQDAEAIETPNSISQIKVPDNNIMTIAIGKEGKVFFGIDGLQARAAMLDNVAQAKGVTFTDKERKQFSQLQNFGVPLNQLKGFLNLSNEQRGQFKQPGIPVDSTAQGPNNELWFWIYNGRKANNELRIAVKGDNMAKFPAFKNVLSTLQAQNINKLNLITGSEAPPAGWKNDAK